MSVLIHPSFGMVIFVILMTLFFVFTFFIALLNFDSANQEMLARSEVTYRQFEKDQEDEAELIINLLGQRVKEHPLWMLSTITGIEVNVLSSLNPSYNKVNIPKKTGGNRQLLIPNNELKQTQKIFAEFINHKFKKKLHIACHSYRAHRGILSNAVPHLGCAVLVKLDIKDFFPNITLEQITDALDLGVNTIDFHPKFDLVKKYGESHHSKITGYLNTQAAQEALTKLVYSEQGLPQGAPTSPILSNLVMTAFDKEVYALVTSMDGAYTRYSDDITISFKEDSSQKIAQVIKFVEAKLVENGFKLNKKKSKINVLRPHQAQRICGVTINSGKPTISRKQRRLVRAAEHNAKSDKPSTFSEDQIKGHQSFQTYVKEHGELLAKGERIEYIKDSGISARGCKVDKGFTILKGSRIDITHLAESKDDIKELVNDLIKHKVLSQKDRNILIFKCNHSFKNKTLATSLLHLRNVKPAGRWT